MRKQFALSSFSGVIQIIVTAFITLISIPIFLKELGTELYGIFAAISVIGNLSVFANLGLNTSLIKFIGENGKTKKSGHAIIVTLIVLFILISILSLLLFVMSQYILVNVLNLPLIHIVEARSLLIYLLIANIFLIVGQAFIAVLDSLQKAYLSNTIQLIYNIFYWGLAILFLSLDFNLQWVGIAALSAAIIWFGLICFASIKHWGNIDLTGFKNSFIPIVKSQLAYGSKLYTSGLIGFCYEPLTKILIARLIGLPEVGYFDIALKVKAQIWGLMTKIMYPLMPYISTINDKTKIRLLIKEVEQKITLLIIPVIIVIFFCAGSFIELWLPGNANRDLIRDGVIFISIFHLLSIITLPAYQFFMIKGHPGVTTIIQFSNVIVNSGTILLLYKFHGFYSIIYSNIIAQIVSLLIAFYFQQKLLNSNMFGYKFTFKIVSSFICIFLGTFLINKLKISEINTLVIIPVSVVLMTILSFRYFKVFHEEDIHFFLGDSKSSRLIKKLLIMSN